MKKKLLALAFVCSLTFPVTLNAEAPQNTYEIDGITITAEHYKIEEATMVDESFDRMVYVDFTVKNDSDQAYGYTTAWLGKTQDGTDLEMYLDFFNLETTLVQPGEEVEATAAFMVEKGTVVDGDLTVTYSFMDYNDDYWNDFVSAMFGEISEEEWKNKYSDFEDLEFVVTPADDASTENEDADSVFSYTNEGHTFTYKDNLVRDGQVLVYFEYTNNSGTTIQPSNALNINAFQNGIELEWMMPGYENVTEEEELAFTNIQDGTTVDIAMIYVLRDDSDISLEIAPQWTTNTTPVGRYTFTLNK